MYMEDVKLYDKIERHWRMVLGGNDGGLDYEKSIMHANRWYFYMNEKYI